MLEFMEYFYPELFYSQISSMYNNPELHPSILDQNPNQDETKKNLIEEDEEEAPEVPVEDESKKYKVVVNIEYD